MCTFVYHETFVSAYSPAHPRHCNSTLISVEERCHFWPVWQERDCDQAHYYSRDALYHVLAIQHILDQNASYLHDEE